jgi:cytochrome b subunit of formate dehydrogenase
MAEKKKKNRIRRFSSAQKLFHLLLLATFLVQGATGLGRMAIETPWGRFLASLFGGYEWCRAIHIHVGTAMLLGFAIHIPYLLWKIDWKNLPESIAGPDSLAPHPRDLKQFAQHIAWFFGGPYPNFDRWGYWEKFDYWAVFWGMMVMGVTGFLLAFPLESSKIVPGWGLNIAFWVHRIEGLLAMTHIFVIHFFIGHLRKHSFPMDRAMFEGRVRLDAADHEKPAWVERLRRSGALDGVLVEGAPLARRACYYAIGYAAIACGLFLLIGGIIFLPRITW